MSQTIRPGSARRQRLVATAPAAPPRRAPGSAPARRPCRGSAACSTSAARGLLQVQRQAFLGAVGPDEVRGQAAHALVVAAREVAAARALDLDHARAQVGQLARGERRGDGVFERDDGDALAAAACVVSAASRWRPSSASLHGPAPTGCTVLPSACGAPLTRIGRPSKVGRSALKRKRRDARPRAPGGAAGRAAAWRSAGRAPPGPGSPRPRSRRAVVVDAVAVEGQRRVAEQQHLVGQRARAARPRRSGARCGGGGTSSGRCASR